MSKRNRRDFIKTTMGIGAGLVAPRMWTRVASPDARTITDPRFTAPVIDPASIPKFVDVLPVPGGNWPVLTGPSHHIALKLIQCQVLPQNAAGFPTLQT
jgi:hypothetical protein